MIHISTRASANKHNSKEEKLLDNFIESGFFEKLKTKRYSYALIQEPYTGFGYADLVCLRWNNSIYDKWNSKRNRLLEDDIKILHYLYKCQKPKTFIQIEMDLGYKNKALYKIIDRLISAELITENKKNCFKVRPLNEIFFIYEIIAVEAKIRDWKKALEQSFNNVFFASKSFSLFPVETINENMLNAYDKTDVGVLSMGKHYREILKPRKMRIPASLTAWRFNEMLGRGCIS
jgi:predicted transcriptional regulator